MLPASKAPAGQYSGSDAPKERTHFVAKKTKKAAPADQWAMFEIPGLTDTQDKPTPPEAKEPTVAELMEKLNLLDKDNRSLRQAFLAQSTRPDPAPLTSTAIPQRAADVQIDMTGLPSPTESPESAEAYAREIARRVNAAQEARLQAEREATSTRDQRTRQVEGVMDAFKAKHPSLAKDREVVEMFATRLLTQAQQKGMDPNKYMFNATDDFVEDLAASMKKVGLGASDETEDEEEEETVGRTAGIPGGQESAQRTSSGGGDPRKNTTPSVIDVLKNFQVKTGFF